MYTFFLGIYKASKIVGVTGYCMVLAELFGMGPLLHLLLPKDLPIDLVWYGLYFGILGRDCAQVRKSTGPWGRCGKDGYRAKGQFKTGLRVGVTLSAVGSSSRWEPWSPSL